MSYDVYANLVSVSDHSILPLQNGIEKVAWQTTDDMWEFRKPTYSLPAVESCHLPGWSRPDSKSCLTGDTDAYGCKPKPLASSLSRMVWFFPTLQLASMKKQNLTKIPSEITCRAKLTKMTQIFYGFLVHCFIHLLLISVIITIIIMPWSSVCIKSWVKISLYIWPMFLSEYAKFAKIQYILAAWKQVSRYLFVIHGSSQTLILLRCR